MNNLYSFKNKEMINLNGFECFNIINNEIVIFENRSIVIIRNSEPVRYRLDDFILSNKPNIKLSEFQIVQNNEFGITHYNSDKFLFILEDIKEGNTSFIVEFNPMNPNELFVHLEVDPRKSKDQKISLHSNGMHLLNQTTPFISSFKKNLIISNNFENQFSTYYIDNKTKRIFTPESELFADKKRKLNLLKEDVSEFMKIIKEWNNDISFGPILPLPKSNKFFRIIKGRTTTLKPLDGPLFIELFDENFEKIGEEKIKNNGNDFSLEYFGSEDKIFIKQISQNENILKYYVLALI